MLSYDKKAIEALALVEPIKSTNNNHIDTEALVRRAHKLRSEFVMNTLKSAFEATVGRYEKHRNIQTAKAALYSMSDRELQDIGINRSEIDFAVTGKSASAPKVSLWKNLAREWVKAQKTRAGYAHLIAMDARQLADIGLTRGDIEAAVNGKLYAQANDNRTVANNNGQRKAV